MRTTDSLKLPEFFQAAKSSPQGIYSITVKIKRQDPNNYSFNIGKLHNQQFSRLKWQSSLPHFSCQFPKCSPNSVRAKWITKENEAQTGFWLSGKGVKGYDLACRQWESAGFDSNFTG